MAKILAALLERERSGRGARVVVSMTHRAHELAQFAGPLTGRLACYRIYETADCRHVTVAALEPKFWRRFCEVAERPDLLARRDDGHAELEELFRTKTLAEWMELFADEDAMVGPVARFAEAEAALAVAKPAASPPRIGEHTDAWRTELGLA